MEDLDMGLGYSSYNINKFNMQICNPLLECQIFWARVVSSGNEGLFTRYTKHSFFEIQYALHGDIAMVMDENVTVPVPQSHFVIVPPDTYHEIRESGGAGSRFIMAFSPKFRQEVLQNAVQALRADTVFRESPHMRQLLSVILGKEYHDEPVRRESITALVECFLLEVVEMALGSTVPESPAGSLTENQRKVAQIQRYIHDYNGIGIHVSGIAQRFNTSERHLNRIFTAVTGHSLRTAIDLEKLKKIEELIATTDLPFSEISELCGFCDGYAMNKFFKRHNRVNLSDFRRLARRTALPNG